MPSHSLIIVVNENRIFHPNKQNIALSVAGVLKITACVFYLLYEDIIGQGYGLR